MSDVATQSRPRRTIAGTPREARLTVVFPLKFRQSVALAGKTIDVGRSQPGGLSFDVPSLSRHHATLSWDAKSRSHWVKDAGSRHGTSLDGAPLDEAAELLHNAVLRFAEVICVYELGEPVEAAPPTEALPGSSMVANALRVAVNRTAADPAPALILGDTGTGKESVASELHRLSKRRGPFLAINCAALSAQLIESQLFGHVKGAFTGADAASPGLFRSANGGTLFLDEIGELPEALQPKLLRALQQKEVLPVGSTAPVKVDVRVVAATNRDLAAEVEAGRFRRDLHARLGLWEISVPPLAARRADLVDWLVLLQNKWAKERAVELRGEPLLEPEAVEALLGSPLRGNLRALEKLVLHLGTVKTPQSAEQLPAWLFDPDSAPKASAPVAQAQRRPAPAKDELLATLERLGSVRATAKHYERDRRQIYRWLEQYAIDWKDR